MSCHTDCWQGLTNITTIIICTIVHLLGTEYVTNHESIKDVYHSSRSSGCLLVLRILSLISTLSDSYPPASWMFTTPKDPFFLYWYLQIAILQYIFISFKLVLHVKKTVIQHQGCLSKKQVPPNSFLSTSSASLLSSLFHFATLSFSACFQR